MQTLRRIDLMSIGKIYAVIGAIYGFVAMLILDIVFAGLLHGTLSVAVTGVLGGLGLIGLPILGVFGIIGGAILGFILSVIGAAIYNVIAEAIGGIRFDISGKPTGIKQIGLSSYVKIFAVFALIVGLVAGIVVTFALPSLLKGTTFGTGSAVMGLVSGFALVGLPILFLIVGTVGATIYVLLFNFFVEKVGAIGVNISGKPMALRHVDALSYVKIVTLIGVVMAIIVGVVHLGLGIGGASAFVGSVIGNIIVTAISGYIGISIFNFVAARMGGIVIDLK